MKLDLVVGLGDLWSNCKRLLFLFPTISWYYSAVPLPIIPQENTQCVVLLFEETANRFRQATGSLMNLWMCVYVHYEHMHTTHSYRHAFPHRHWHHKCTQLFSLSHTHTHIHTHCLSLGTEACLRNFWSPGEFNVSTGGDRLFLACSIYRLTLHVIFSILLCTCCIFSSV